MKAFKTNAGRSLACGLGFLASLTLVPAHAGANGGPDLETVLAGTKKQFVKQLDKAGLSLVLNEQLGEVMLEGWNTKAMTQAEADKLLAKFGVRTVENAADGTAHFMAPSDVGRAGILDGEVFMKLDGKIYKGLTLKGYGGNTIHGRSVQPEGSLEFTESIRDMEVSKVLVEGGVDTYVGVLSVKRPDAASGMRASAGARSNYVRLSRTALRMNHLIDLRGKELEKVVNYLTDLLKDEMGKKLTTGEFAQWIAQKSGDLIARKEHIRFKHASVTTSNLGIGEMVDLGDPWNSGMMLPDEYRAGQQMGEFKRITQAAFDNIRDIEPSLKNANFDQLFDNAYESRLKELQLLDRSKVNLNRASESELIKMGFTQAEAVEVIRYNTSLADGIIDAAELKQVKAIGRDIARVLEQATTDFMTLSDGTQLQRYYIRNVGGAEGVREILKEAREYMKGQGKFDLKRNGSGQIVRNADVERLEAQLEKIAVERAKKLGNWKAEMGNDVTRFSKFVARQALEVIVRR